MTAHEKTQELRRLLARKNITLPVEAVQTLRRAQIVLRTWYTTVCNNDSHEDTGIVYVRGTRTKIANRERGAVKKVAAVCQQYGLHYYLQDDPRGCSLYIGTEPLLDNSYSSNGVACSV